MKLLLGAGNKTEPGFTTMDILPSADIVADLEKKPWPVPDNSVDHLYAANILEHLHDPVGVMEEIYRICKDGATVGIHVPYFKSTAQFKQPTHVTAFTERSFEYFDADHLSQDERNMMAAGSLKANFRTEKITYNYYTRGTRFFPFKGLLRRFLWDIVKTIDFNLRVVKSGAPKAGL